MLATLVLGAGLFVGLFVGGCDGERVSVGTLECMPSSCAGPPILPEVACPDGTRGGASCELDPDAGACVWVEHECPAPPPCEPEDCGFVAPTTSGPSVCQRVDGVCQWVEDGTCARVDCGPRPTERSSWVCEDGSRGGFTDRCLADESGGCTWEVRACTPSVACTEATCGPEPTVPECPGVRPTCLPDVDGMCRWTAPSCSIGTSTCMGDGECGLGEYCEVGTGGCGARGSCRVAPAACERPSTTSATVCGCDGMVYESACEAHRAGVTIASVGACS